MTYVDASTNPGRNQQPSVTDRRRYLTRHVPAGQPLLILDTNVWRYLIDADSVERVRKVARNEGVILVACPAVAYEMMRTGDHALRAKLVRTITRECWTRIMPEAYIESEEFLHLVRRERPEWLRDQPDLRWWHALRADWQSGWWMRARNTTNAEAKRIDELGAKRLQEARQQYTQARDAVTSLAPPPQLNLGHARVAVTSPDPRWDGREVDAWRVWTANQWARALQPGSLRKTPGDWVAPWLNFAEARSNTADWLELWFEAAVEQESPAMWLRWAFQELQFRRKASDGSPVDNQISSYLPFVDHFATADRIFFQIAETIAEDSPVRLATSHRLPGGSACVEALAALIPTLKCSK